MRINKEPIKKVKSIIEKEKAKIIILSTLAITGTSVYAGGLNKDVGVDMWNGFLEFIATWMGRIGIGVLLFGAYQVGFGIKNDDPDAKTKGLKTAASGIIVFAISQSLDFFTGIS